MKAKVLLCQFDALEYYSYMVLSSQLKKYNIEHEVEIIQNEEAFYRELKERYSDFNIIGFSTSNVDYQRILRVSSKIKEHFKDKIIVLGGPHPTLAAETVDFNVVDFICIGAGEFYFADWIKGGYFSQKINYRNLICQLSSPYEVKFVTDLDESPFPNREIYYKKFTFMRESIRRFLFSSGCPYNCSYCYNVNFRTKFKDNYPKEVLFKSPKIAIEEIKQVLNKYPAQGIVFLDDNLCINKEWLSEFLDLYAKEVAKPFNMNSSVNNLSDGLIEKLCSSGLKIIRVAMETTNEQIRRDILNRPIYTNEQFALIAKKLRRHKVRVIMLNMFCLPEQTIDDCVKAFRFANKQKVIMYVTIFVPFKGTRIYQYCLEHKLIIDPTATEDMFGKASLKGEDMERMVTLQNYTFILNYFGFMLTAIVYLSRFRWFRKASFKFVFPINLIAMHLPLYYGLFSFRKYLIIGIENLKTKSWRRK